MLIKIHVAPFQISLKKSLKKGAWEYTEIKDQEGSFTIALSPGISEMNSKPWFR